MSSEVSSKVPTFLLCCDTTPCQKILKSLHELGDGSHNYLSYCLAAENASSVLLAPFFIDLVPPFVCPYSRNWYHPKQAISMLQHMGIRYSKPGSSLAALTETLAGSSWYKSYFFWMVPQSVFLPPSLLWVSMNPRNLTLVDGKVANAHAHKKQQKCSFSVFFPCWLQTNAYNIASSLAPANPTSAL